MKKLTALFFVLLFIAAIAVPAYAAVPDGISRASNTKVIINGERASFEVVPVIKNERLLLPARETFQKLNAQYSYNYEVGTIEASRDGINISAAVGESNLKINGTSIQMDVEPILAEGNVMVPVRFIAEAFKIPVGWDDASRSVYLGILKKETGVSRGSSQGTNTGGKPFVVVVDPGHGGKEIGADYGGAFEKDLNLDIAKRLNELLAAEGIKTYMTRTDDSYVGLYERSGLANNVDADLLVSVHNNAGGGYGAQGSMTLYSPGRSNNRGSLTARGFAAIVQENLVEALGTKNMGVIQRPNLAVLRTSNMPAVIAEIAFMDNKAELARLKTPEFRQRTAEALKNAVLAALKEI